MIALLVGNIVEKTKDSLTLLTEGGVGYELHMSPFQLTRYTVGHTATIFTYLKVSESALDLYGFDTVVERSFFTVLMTVSGVGPKTAMNILSLGSIEQIQAAIVRGDVKYLTAVSGLGKKTAERLVVELKGKLAATAESVGAPAGTSDVVADVIEALVGMGYRREEAKTAATAVNLSGKTIEEALRIALQHMT